jgi:hypothetical protein
MKEKMLPETIRQHDALVEQFRQERFFTFAPLVIIVVTVNHPRRFRARRGAGKDWGSRRRLTALDDFVDFASVEPNAAAGWAIIDFNIST